jgi:hypothetical protein
MLYLLENPGIREAFFPTGAQLYSLERARAEDGIAIRQIVERHEGSVAQRGLVAWWSQAPESFRVVRDRTGDTVGFYCLLDSETVPEWLVEEDPLLKNWRRHLSEDPLANNETALFIRRWLSKDEGEQPSAIQAACWLDIKRTYLMLRPRLRRAYLALEDIAPYGPAAQTLGFAAVPSCCLMAGDRTYHTAMLDFGPASVDGWLGRLVAAELGLSPNEMLDVEGRELVVDGRRIPLTRLEFTVFRYLREHEGKAVGREALIRDVWGLKYDVGSNVVDAVIKTLRKKLGARSEMIETVAGHGYKLRASA